MSEILSLNQLNALPSTECQCDICRAMCSDSRPCWGTPKEIKVLLDNGFANKLMCDYYEGTLNGINIGYVEIITPALVGYECGSAPTWPVGRCVLLTKNGACSIHSMKPLEGRVCDHNNHFETEPVHESIVLQWKTKEGKEVVKLWRKLK